MSDITNTGARFHLRVARPVSNLQRAQQMYCAGLGLEVIDGFENHEGFDGVMLGFRGCDYHLEFTYCRTHPVRPNPTPDDCIVLYIPHFARWRTMCSSMQRAGFELVESFNSYWDKNGRTYQDHDGYRVVLQRENWHGPGGIPLTD